MAGGRLLCATVSAALGACLLAAAAGPAAPSLPRWSPLLNIAAVVDVVGPRADGQLVLATRGGLFLLRPGARPTEFARGPSGYVPSGGEPYVALAPARRLPGARCSFHRDDVFALDPDSTPGIVRVTRGGQMLRLADLPHGAFPSGIAFDLVGRFGYRLLVTSGFGDKTTLYALDCLGQMTAVAQGAPHVEGGIVVAPRSFGRFGGDLIAADEQSGRIFAFDARGRVSLVVRSGVRAGGDIGVEGLGFVPSALGRRGAAYLSDLHAPGSPTEGADSLLALRGAALRRAGLATGELVAATEAGATTIAVRCSRRCTARHVADGPTVTHGEGHVTFVPGP